MNLENALLRGTRALQPSATSTPEGCLYYVTDELKLEQVRSGAWVSYSGSASAISQLTGDVTAGPGSGSQVATIGNDKVVTAKILDANVTLAKIVGVSAASRLIGRGAAAGAGVQQEIALGTNLSMSGTTLNATGGSGASVGPAFTAPVDAQFSWVNQGTASVNSADQGILLTAPAAAGIALRIRKKAAPATPYTVTVAILPTFGIQTNAGAYYGMLFRQSSNGKISAFLLYQVPNGEMLSIKFDDPSTFNAIYTPPGNPLQSSLNVPQNNIPLMWLRLADDGTNRSMSYSIDGYDFTTFHTIGRTDFITPDEVGFFTNSQNATTGSKIRLLSWKEA